MCWKIVRSAIASIICLLAVGCSSALGPDADSKDGTLAESKEQSYSKDAWVSQLEQGPESASEQDSVDADTAGTGLGCDHPIVPADPTAGNSLGLNRHGEDVCAVAGWYCDGECDEFCFERDPDCDASCPDPADASVSYVSTDPATCVALDYACGSAETSFDGPCGCGCISTTPDCPSASDPDVHYVSTDPDVCAAADFACDTNQVVFDDACGCGCIGPTDPTGCPDPADPNVHYQFQDVDLCRAADFICGANQTMFDDDCGCGCIDS